MANNDYSLALLLLLAQIVVVILMHATLYSVYKIVILNSTLCFRNGFYVRLLKCLVEFDYI